MNSDSDAYITGASSSITIRVRLENRPGMLARCTSIIGEKGGNIGAIDIVRVEKNTIVRDITIYIQDSDKVGEIRTALRSIQGVEVINISDRTFLLHLGGKIEVRSKTEIRTRDKLSMAYTPGVARVCRAIAEDEEKVYNLTMKGHMVAVVTDGTAVLGLGDIGPSAALPVMEGKAQLFKEFGGVNAFPICLDTTDTDAIVETVKNIAPGFGGINLEDIAAPRCFEVERRLKQELDIPIFHDDQHGTAVVTTAALINALKVVGKRVEALKVVVAGVGAAGTAVTRMLMDLGCRNIIGVDREGALARTRNDLSEEKLAYARQTNPNEETGRLSDVIVGADVFIGLSAPGILSVDDVQEMVDDPIVFAMANPDPEIKPEEAWPHVTVMATGRSDYPNQINNVLCFPGLFKGALACRARDINEEMKMAAARAIAETISDDDLTADYIVPSVFDRRVAEQVATAVRAAAEESEVARRIRYVADEETE
jgi:malate dehydrogenase (oxaloacetate-decarboxylating)